MANKIPTIGLGGTFDHFHAGHEKFISFAATIADQLFIGVTTEKMVKGKSLPHLIEPYPVRLQAVKAYCHKNHIRAKVTPLEDELGPTLEGAQVRALCVTEETIPGAEKINTIRERLGLYKFPIYICDYVLDENGEPIHSARIRAGLVNRTGKVYQNLFKSDRSLSEEGRAFFSQPLGEVITNLSEFKRSKEYAHKKIIAVVGDSSLEHFIDQHLPYHLGVYDQLQQRKAYNPKVMESISPDFTVKNPAGVITTELADALRQCISTSHQAKTKHILVHGEEDLAAVALILLLPLESEVYYGQPNHGVVCMKIDENLKDDSYRLLSS